MTLRVIKKGINNNLKLVSIKDNDDIITNNKLNKS
jgi:hypothetical protein